MKKRILRLLAPIVTAALLLGCAAQSGGSLREHLQTREEKPKLLSFRQMTYTRPDMQALEEALDKACEASKGSDPDAVMESVYEYYDAYDWFYTAYCLADIYYSMDLTDVYWETEYNFCVEKSVEVDAGLEELYYTLARSPCREALEGEDYFGEGFFSSYDGENNWDETFTALLDEEARLENLYYSLCADASGMDSGSVRYYDTYADDMAQVLVDLIGIRQEMAAYWGYESYVDFAWDFYYYRDYTPGEMEDYMTRISRELSPIYRELADTDVWDRAYRYASEEDTFAFVKTAAMNMGGTVAKAFEEMERRGLYDLSYSPNKYATSFEVYLTSYRVPFVFVCPGREVYDRLTLAHEFGHFCNDYASEGSYAGIDVLEVFSQAMEYLSLCYGEDTEELTRVKLADGLCTHVEQAAFASFEHRAYSLTGEELTVEGLYGLYEQVALEFGFEAVGYDPREFVTVTHFFTNPMYIDSYVVSNDAALQIYIQELEKPGMGLRRFEDTLSTGQSYFLTYLKEARLESPFAEGQLESLRDLFRETLLTD